MSILCFEGALAIYLKNQRQVTFFYPTLIGGQKQTESRSLQGNCIKNMDSLIKTLNLYNTASVSNNLNTRKLYLWFITAFLQ